MPEKIEAVEVGKEVRLFCVGCRTKYEIVHEPEYRDPEMAESFGGKAKAPKWCPFCGDEDLVTE